MFCDKLRDIRKLHNITQAKLASVLGMSRQAVIKYESGERFPDEVTLVNIANFFGISLDHLLDRKVNNKEYLASLIVSKFNETELSDISNKKVEFILNVMDSLIKEFDKYEKK